MRATVSRLLLYPVKGCRGIALAHATLAATGLEHEGIGDREWMIVDAEGEFLSQRELPRMALIGTELAGGALRLSAAGRSPIEVSLEAQGESLRVRVWDDTVAAITQGAAADAWVSDVLARPARLVRFDRSSHRWSNRRYTGSLAAPYKFADAFALLVTSEASLAEVNRRLLARGSSAIGIERFRPNLVLDGVEAFEEDYVRELRIGDARLANVKPCVRCSVPDVDPESGERGHEPGDTLTLFRDRPTAGGITFGVNAVVAAGAGTSLRVGVPVDVELSF